MAGVPLPRANPKRRFDMKTLGQPGRDWLFITKGTTNHIARKTREGAVQLGYRQPV